MVFVDRRRPSVRSTRIARGGGARAKAKALAKSKTRVNKAMKAKED